MWLKSPVLDILQRPYIDDLAVAYAAVFWMSRNAAKETNDFGDELKKAKKPPGNKIRILE